MAKGKRQPTPDILGDVLGPDDAGGGASPQPADTAGDTEEEQGRGEAPDTAGKEGSIAQSNGAEEVAKRKATYYLSEDVLSELEEGWFALRQMATRGEKGSVSKSAIVEAALKEALEELESEGKGSALAQQLLE